jgi:hypothetical protein
MRFSRGPWGWQYQLKCETVKLAAILGVAALTLLPAFLWAKYF